MSTEDERYRRYFHDAEFRYRSKIVSEILKCDRAVDGFYADGIAIRVVDALFPEAEEPSPYEGLAARWLRDFNAGVIPAGRAAEIFGDGFRSGDVR